LFVYDAAMNIAQYLLLAPLVLNLTPVLHSGDIDSDGLDDSFEQQILERFVPTWMLSAKECDSLPAEFHPDSRAPQSQARNGTIYGQVFPINPPGRPGVFIEAHYYHLWNRDCGLNGHAWDVEHVSALLSAEKPEDPASEWKSEYWYAAAHEDTVCDSSHAAKSSSLNAEQRGPTIWISAGKHASFLDRSLCSGGCGGDDCSDMSPMKISGLVNLGEPGAPINGASWAQWSGWSLGAKMETEFPEDVLAKLDVAEPSEIIPVNDSRAPVKTTILVGASSAEAMIGTNHKAGAALSSTNDAVGASLAGAAVGTNHKTGAALSSASGAVGASLDKSNDGTRNFLIRAAGGVRSLVSGVGKNADSENGGQR
jgi:hypothetical protein